MSIIKMQVFQASDMLPSEAIRIINEKIKKVIPENAKITTNSIAIHRDKYECTIINSISWEEFGGK